jgi:chondroitin 4-sulfotransferase 11
MIKINNTVNKMLRHINVVHNNKNKVRFGVCISIPKNASKSVLDILELGPNSDEENTASLIIYENHQRATILSKKYDFNNLFVFTFVRNPYDRCISWYEYHKNLEPYRSLSFSTWIEQEMPHHWKIQNQTDFELEGISPLLQYNFVERQKVDFIGKIESFLDDMKTIIVKLNMLCKKNDITYRFDFIDKQVNTSNRSYDWHYYVRETKEMVSSLLNKDFEFFGYEK